MRREEYMVGIYSEGLASFFIGTTKPPFSSGCGGYFFYSLETRCAIFFENQLRDSLALFYVVWGITVVMKAYD